jgi:hypothetical protein
MPPPPSEPAVPVSGDWLKQALMAWGRAVCLPEGDTNEFVVEVKQGRFADLCRRSGPRGSQSAGEGLEAQAG